MADDDALAEKRAALTKQDNVTDVLAPAPEDANYEPSDVFTWANNLVQYKDELKVEIFFFNKNYVVYKTTRAKELNKMMEPIFVDEILEYVLEGAANGLIVRGFEDAEQEENVLQFTRLKNVEKAVEVINWLKHQAHEIETFDDEEHDIKRMKGVIARISHDGLKKPAYVIKAMQQSQVIRGKAGWMIREGKLVPFDADAALRITPDNQLLVLDQDMYVFSQAKLKSLFGYDAKEASIAEAKVREIEEHFQLSFAEGLSMQALVKGNRSVIKKLQKIEPMLMTQSAMMDHAEEMGVNLMTDPNGKIIIMDEKDMKLFVDLLNDDIMESPVTGIRYEIKAKRELKPPSEDDLLKEVS
ncbi:MAG TPA: Kiwa anti-phage protein KwaB-like domain-containing protein [Candidatus Microsaccharimonas sp.]|nr:Kiwa anti-phage protein KwaB-like domain-containing protein [Candidatus Microsaccharimonas sp.]